jgi:hypothetical protein
VVEVATNTEEFVAAVNSVTEVNVVHLVDVSLVHVTAKEGLGNGIGGADLKEVHDAEELLLSHVAVLGNVKVLEDGLEQNAASCHSLLVFGENCLNVHLGLSLEVLAAGENGLVFGDRGDSDHGFLLDSTSGEGIVYGGAESDIVEEFFLVVGNILVSERLVLFVGEGETELGKD